VVATGAQNPTIDKAEFEKKPMLMDLSIRKM
jgi:hypothetical protein